MAGNEADEEEAQFEVKFREDEELEFFTELALHETERWVTAVTKKPFSHPDDPRKSLENGILLCELLNCLKPGAVKRINKLPTPIAGLDNLNVFLKACREHFGLNDTHLFDPSDLEDLSQRAIAESEQLKDELDRRLRKVAISVYWLGRSVHDTFPGPKLDQSAFAALVHHQHRHSQPLLSDSSLRKESVSDSQRRVSGHSWESNGPAGGGHGWAEGGSGGHRRDGSLDSYASYGKGSEDSLDEHVFETDEHGMPIPRYGSASALNRSGTHSEGGSMYSSDRNSSFYRSSPDLFHSSKQRSSSTDSGDGSFHGSHSRQSSDSTEMYPTRRFSTQMPTRKTSASADPLQFIKSKGAQDLAVAAEQQMKLVAETKKIKFTGTPKDEDTDWQSNLSNWKNRRKSQSERSYQLKEELEQMEREKEEPRSSAPPTTKTFAQMQEERERRKSAGTKSFYPIEDEEEQDDIFTPSTASKQESSPLSTSSHFQSSTPAREEKSKPRLFSQPEVAPWAEDSGSEKEEEEKGREENNNSTSKKKSPERPATIDQDRNTDRATDAKTRRRGLYSDRDSVQKSFSENRDSASKVNDRNGTNAANGGRSQNKISNILKSFEQKEEESAKPRSVEPLVDVSARKKSFENSGAGKAEESAPSRVESRRSWRNADLEEKPAAPVYASSKQSGKDYVERTIKISQKPNNHRGFGFELSGGADERKPVIVEKITLGGAADICELQARDEVLAINRESVEHMTHADIKRKVDEAVRVGQIEIRVKRLLGSGGAFEEEDFLSSEEELLETPERSVSKSSSLRAENSFDSLDSRDEQQSKTEPEPVQQWLEEQTTPSSVSSLQTTRRGDPTSTSSDSGYDAQTFSSIYSNEDDAPQSQPADEQTQSSVGSRRRHFYPFDNDEDSGGYGQDKEKEKQGSVSADQCEPEVTRSEQVEVESRPSASSRRRQMDSGVEDDSKPLATSNQNSTTQQDDNSDFGPPAVLRKWQRQRPRVEYTFESDDQPPHFYNQIRLSSTLPRGSDKPDMDTGFSKDDSVLDRPSHSSDSSAHSHPSQEVSSRRLNLSDERRRIEDWNSKQEQQRQPADLQPAAIGSQLEIQIPFDKQRFEAEREQINQQYQADLQRAADAERQKQDQENDLLAPEREKMRILEERRAERQARIQQYARDAAEHSGLPQQSAAPATQHTSTWSTQLPGNNNTTNASPSILVIDPRNRGDDAGQEDEGGRAFQIQLTLNQPETMRGMELKPEVLQTIQTSGPSPADQQALLEAERERIRQVERERIRQEELQRLESERRQKEEEEMKRIRAMEEQLRQQQELLRQQEEELRRKHERLERERKQLHQQVVQPPPQQQQQPQHDNLVQYETVTSKVRGGAPAYTSTVVAGPRRSEGHPQVSGGRNRDSGPGYSSGYGSGGSGYGSGGSGYAPRRSEPAWDSGRSQHRPAENSWRGTGQPASASQLGLPKWPPAASEQDRGGNSQHGHEPVRRQLSREDMVAMNRKATPLHAKPPSPTPPPSDHTPSHTAPIIREAPSKGEKHSLNSVPRARIRNPDGWISSSRDTDDSANFSDHSGSSREGRKPTTQPRRSEAYRSQLGGPEDHWLIQEAERRRLHDSGDQHGPARQQFSGPIKPASDRFGNRWRDDSPQDNRSSMPAQIRQTLLQKTAGARGSTGSNYSQELNAPVGSSLRQSRASPNTSMSQTLPPDYRYDYNQRPRQEAMPPTHRPPSPEGRQENGMSISGKQCCSYCNKELGFGAAMVIESLGLFYHVQCFRCCVCHTPLGDGVQGADVRVRVNKLHCPNCYSNDEAGLKFSKV